MKLESINLENWKIFRSPIKVEFSPGINILYGTNESGKSTLIEAIRLVFFNKHNSKSQKIKDIVPWGSKLYPQANIIFQENEEIYRINKRFMSPESNLEKYYNDSWNMVADRDQADKEVVKILGGNLPTRGDSKPEFWGLGQSLWMVQGKPLITDELNAETISSLKGLIGAAIESEEEKKVLEQIHKEFSSVYTESKRNPRAGSKLLKMNEELIGLKKDLTEVNTHKIRKEELIRDIEDKDSFLRKKMSELVNAENKKLELKNEVVSARNHLEERQLLESEINNLNSQYEVLKGQIHDINDNKLTIKNLLELQEELKLKENPLHENFENNKIVLDDVVKRLSYVERQIDDNIEEKRIAGIAHTTVMEEQNLKEKLSKLEYVEEVSSQIAKIKIEMSSLKSPSLEEVEDIEELAAQILDTETRLDAIGLTIETDLNSGISGKMFLDGDEKPLILNDEIKSLKAHQSIKFNIENIGFISISSGSQDVKRMQENLQGQYLLYKEKIAPYGDDEPHKLRELYNRKLTLDNSLIQLNNDLSKHAEKGREELEKEVTRLTTKIELNWAKIPSESRFKNCQDKEDLQQVIEILSKKINQNEKETLDLREKRDNLRLELENEQSIKDDLQSQILNLNGDIRGNKERLEQVREQLIKQESDGLIQGKEDKLNKLSQSLERKQRAHKVYTDEVVEKETRPLSEFDAIENMVNNLKEGINKLKIDHSNFKRELELLISNFQDSNKLEEELENLENQYKELETDAKAFELLYDISTQYKTSTIEALSEPVKNIFSQDLEKLIGSKYCFNFGKDMKPGNVDVLGVNEKTTLDCLSFGTQEQIWYLFRLALGRLLSKEERQLVILDDPLVNTDEARHQRALEILQDTAREVQLIVVTCDMDKYSSLDAKFIGLERGELIK